MHAEAHPAARRTARAAATQQASVAEFMRRKAAVDALLARLAAASEDHFGADPEGYLWGQAGSLGHAEEVLTDLCAVLCA